MRIGYSPHTKNEVIKVRLDASKKTKLEERAALFNMTLSEVIREAVSMWLNLNNPKRED